MKDSVLEKIVADRRRRIVEEKQKADFERLKKAASIGETISLTQALQEPGISLIAEVKTASPSRGTIRTNTSITEIVGVYESAGASAVSVLTEPDHFQGSWRFLRAAKEFCMLPILCKDFIIDEYQLYMARDQGADAVLLIAAILNDEELGELIDLAHKLGLEVLTEAINAAELERVVSSKSDIIGLNSRNLHTLEVDLSAGLKLVGTINDKRPAVVESGIFTRQDVLSVEASGAAGILVGTAIMESANIEEKIKELLGND